MNARNHQVESEGANPRDHLHIRHHIARHVHRNWKVVLAVGVMLFAILIYEVSDNLSLRPGKHAVGPTPEAIAP
jgi:hypothetical protein